MKRLFTHLTLLAATTGLLLTSGILKGNNVQDSLDPFVDSAIYEKPVAEIYREPLYAEDDEPAADVKKVIIHYYNNDKKNNTRQIYTWTTGGDAKMTALVQDSDDTSGDYWHIELDLTSTDAAYAGKDFLNFIVKYAGTWTGQSLDTLLEYSEFPPNASGVVEVWTMKGEKGKIDIFKTKRETQLEKANKAYFTDWKTIHVMADAAPKLYRLYALDKAYLVSNEVKQERLKASRLIKTGTPNGKDFDIKFNYIAHVNVQYYLETEYSTHEKVQSIVVTSEKLYNNSNFVKYYSSYKGNDLGCTWTKDKTTFKVWAPTAGAIMLNVYNKGTPKGLVKGGSNACVSYVMTMGEQGVWEKTLLTPEEGDNLNGKYYTYTVYNSEGINEVVDPYAKSAGVNGKRGMILDFKSTDPTDWDKVKFEKLDSPQRLSIYEIHIRDLTEDKTWGGKEKNGSFKAFYEKKTQYQTVSTGFDHIEEMNVKAIQIMPVFDHDNNELEYYYKRDAEGKKTEETVYVSRGYDGEYKDELELEYNWGYNPLNYNVIEGSYSSNPEDGAARVKEFKELVKAYANNKNNTRVTMDVVYNHVSSVTNSNFTKLMPLYYFRFNEKADEYWNGSGCSNEVKTEAPMMRKFIVDSLCWWASEYKIKGFRFDLMELIDMNTLNEARKALYKIDPDIYLYGEGWKADASGLVGEGGGANTDNVYNSAKAASGSVFLGAFNNGGRDSIKGGNDGGSTGKSNFYWDGGSEAAKKGSNYTEYPLNIGGWAASNAQVWVHAWRTDTDFKDYKLTDTTKLKIYDNYTNFVLVRLSPDAKSIAWSGDTFWGQSTDLSVGKGTLMFKDWGSIRTPGRDSFMTSGSGYSDQVGKMATGYNCFSGVSNQDPRQTVNYASCHDNFTLYDQLSWGLAANPSKTSASTAASTANIMKAVTAVEQAVALSNGVAFILGGDELLRTKEEDHPEKSREDEDYVKMFGKNISHNSYKSSTFTNSFKWDRKVTVKGYVGSATNNAWKLIADAFSARNHMTKFATYSNRQGSAGPDCNYFDASTTSSYVGWYLGGYTMNFAGKGSLSLTYSK